MIHYLDVDLKTHVIDLAAEHDLIVLRVHLDPQGNPARDVGDDELWKVVVPLSRGEVPVHVELPLVRKLWMHFNAHRLVNRLRAILNVIWNGRSFGRLCD